MAGAVDGAGDWVAFPVRAAVVQEPAEENLLLVGLGENPDGTGQSLVFSVFLDPVAAGEDHAAYCFSDETGATHYGGVVRCALDGDDLVISLDPRAGEAMAAGAGYRLRLLVDADARLQLAHGLRRVLTATDTPPTLNL